MRYALLLLPFVVAGCAATYPGEYGYNTPPPQPAAGYGYYSQTPAPGPQYAYNGTDYGTASAGNTENCGTPYAFKACPPLPRHPLPYYPGDRP